MNQSRKGIKFEELNHQSDKLFASIDSFRTDTSMRYYDPDQKESNQKTFKKQITVPKENLNNFSGSLAEFNNGSI